MTDIRRLRYYQGQYLGALDFEAEQAYHLSMRRRHNLGPHTWGIVAGLELTEQDNGDGTVGVWVGAGMAIDGRGREVFVLERRQLDPAEFQALQLKKGAQPVYIAYDEEQASPPAYGYDYCDDEGNERRIAETYRLYYGDQAGLADPVEVDGDSEVVDFSVPHQQLADSAKQRWLIMLGKVVWDPDQQSFTASTLLESDRRYAGVVAATIDAPDGALSLRDRRAHTGGDPPPVADLLATVEGKLQVDDVTTAKGDLELHGAKLELLDDGGAAPAVAVGRLQPGGGGGVDLQLDLGEEDKGDNRLTVQSKSADRFTVADDGTTRIHGDTTVEDGSDLTVDGGTLGISRQGSSPPTWRLKVDDATNALQFRESVAEADPEGRVAFELLTVGNDHDPVIQLFGDGDAQLSAAQLIDLTDGQVTLLHLHRSATTALRGMVEIATSGEDGVTGSSGARLVVAANDARLLTTLQKNNLTNGNLTTLHRHNSPLLGNVNRYLLDASFDTDTVLANLGSQKRVVAFVALSEYEPFLSSGVEATIDWIDGVNYTGGSVYNGLATQLRFRLSCSGGTAEATGCIIYEDV